MGKGGGVVYCVIITLLILGGIATLIAWLADKMKSPSFSIDQGQINSYNFSSSNHLNATFTFVVRSHNRDSRYKIKYHEIAVAVYHSNDYSLGYDHLGPYTLGQKDDLVFSARPVVQDVPVLDDGVAGAIREEGKVGELRVDVRVRGKMRFEIKGWKHRGYTFKAICDPMVINLVNGKSSQRSNCGFTRF